MNVFRNILTAFFAVCGMVLLCVAVVYANGAGYDLFQVIAEMTRVK